MHKRALLVSCTFFKTDYSPTTTYNTKSVSDYLLSKCKEAGIICHIDLHDTTYGIISDAFLREYNNEFKFKIVGKGYIKEARDCDDFTNYYHAYLTFFREDNVEAAYTVGKVYITGHVLIGAMTESGLYIIEPQTLTKTPLKDFARRKEIYRIVM